MAARVSFVVQSVALFIFVFGWSVIILTDFSLTESLSTSSLVTMLAACGQIVATVAGILIATTFIAAQVRASGEYTVNLTIRQYTAAGVMPMVVIGSAGIATSVIGLRAASVLELDLARRLGDASLVATLGVGLLIVPIVIRQIENLDPQRVAASLAKTITPRRIEEYGLADAAFARGQGGRVTYQLMTYGTDYARDDPLRPIHEVVRIAIPDRDRVLLGRLLRSLVSPIPQIYGCRWVVDERTRTRGRSVVLFRRGRRSRFDPRKPVETERIAVTLHLCHYLVRMSRNLRRSWEGLDVGRHSVTVVIIDLIRAISPNPGSSQAIDILLSAAYHVNVEYAGVNPYGRVEPLNHLFTIAPELQRHGHAAQAERVSAVLGSLYARTSQLSQDRCPQLWESLPSPLKDEFVRAVRASEDSEWLPTPPAGDPWAPDWIPQPELPEDEDAQDVGADPESG